MKKNNRVFIAVIILCSVASWVSSAKSQNWVQKIDSPFVYSITENNGALYAVTPEVIYKSADAGDSWQPTTGQPNLTDDLFRIFAHGEFVYTGTFKDGVFRSNDGGQSWQSLNAGLPISGGIVGFTVLGDSLYAGTGGSGVYVLNLQNPSTWSSYNSGLFQFGVNTIGASGNHLVAGISLYLFVRPRGGAQWTDVYVDSIGVQRLIYETFPMGQYLFAGTNRGVYRGALDAQNWQRVDIMAFPNEDIVAFEAYQSMLMAGLLYQGQYWIFSTNDAGVTWDSRAHEFAELFDLFVSGNRLWAGRTDGLWYFDLDFWTSVDSPESRVPSRFHLAQNYPNPFNPSTKISFAIPQAGHVDMKIYDLLGREIFTALSEFRNSGSHTIDFNSASLASGLYIYKIRTGEYQAAKKMIVMK
jgi:photosystem II stability/assembly factor-like uncharacterized protein